MAPDTEGTTIQIQEGKSYYDREGNAWLCSEIVEDSWGTCCWCRAHDGTAGSGYFTISGGYFTINGRYFFDGTPFRFDLIKELD